MRRRAASTSSTGRRISLHIRQAQPIVILAELPPERAFDLWKQYVLGDKPD